MMPRTPCTFNALRWAFLLGISCCCTNVGGFIHRDRNAPRHTRNFARMHRELRSSVNPNDLQTPEERANRMELVRQLQKSFYADESGITKNMDGVFEDVPLWRVQWTELPGYQNVLNCHVPHYTHMFMKVLNGPKPWYFGHVYLPGGSENLDNPRYRLCDPASEAAHTGALMQVSDYRQLEDGRLLLIAQALGRFEVAEVTQHLPYAVATVRLTPDEELVRAHLAEATGLASSQGMGEEEAWAAACVGAVTETMHWEPFEFRSVRVEECMGGGSGVSPIANFDAESLPPRDCDARAAMAEYLKGSQVRPILDVPLNYSAGGVEQVLELEKDTWVSLDFMLQLLMACMEKASSGPGAAQVPIPTQLLGLLPNRLDWPEGFKLDSFAERMAMEGSLVGTLSKSPFLWVDRAAPLYPDLRRAQRFSFAVWTLLESVMAGYDPASQTRQSVLELSSITERMKAAKQGLDTINVQLRRSLGQD